MGILTLGSLFDGSGVVLPCAFLHWPVLCGYTRERWRLPFYPPARRAVFRRQRQRDLSLWTPFHRLRAGRGADMPVYLCCFGPPKGRRAEGAAAASLSACEYIIGAIN